MDKQAYVVADEVNSFFFSPSQNQTEDVSIPSIGYVVGWAHFKVTHQEDTVMLVSLS